MKHLTYASYALQAGLALMFFYAAFGSFFQPDSWIGYFPQFLRSLVPPALLLNGFSVFELLLGVWLLWGKWKMYAALVSAATLLGIVVFNASLLDIVFRDIGLALAALALFFLAREQHT